MGLPSGVESSGAQEASVGAHDAFFQIVFGSDFFRFLVDFGRIWGAKTEAKIEFLGNCLHCFFRSPFGIDFGSFLGGPKPRK